MGIHKGSLHNEDNLCVCFPALRELHSLWSEYPNRTAVFSVKTFSFVFCTENRWFRPALGSVLTFWIKC